MRERVVRSLRKKNDGRGEEEALEEKERDQRRARLPIYRGEER